MRGRVISAVVAGVLTAVVMPFAHAQTPSVEEELLGYINASRGAKQVVMHAGLREVARKHSEAMAVAGSLNHRRAKQRIESASADRPQEGGGSDRGFNGTWCEVVGWEPGGPDAGVARRFFADWRETAEDNKCMSNTDMTVAGVGVYERGNRWWATLEMAQDTTLPVPVRSTPQPAETIAKPAVSAAPTNLAESRTSATESSGVGPKEIAVAAGGFLVVPVLHFLRRRRAARV